MKKSYLLTIYYMNKKINKYEYQKQDFLIYASSKTLKDVVKEEIKTFNEVNKQWGYKVESYSVYEHILSKNI